MGERGRRMLRVWAAGGGDHRQPCLPCPPKRLSPLCPPALHSHSSPARRPRPDTNLHQHGTSSPTAAALSSAMRPPAAGLGHSPARRR